MPSRLGPYRSLQPSHRPQQAGAASIETSASQCRQGSPNLGKRKPQCLFLAQEAILTMEFNDGTTQTARNLPYGQPAQTPMPPECNRQEENRSERATLLRVDPRADPRPGGGGPGDATEWYI
jgi:hypothetical protein